MEEKGGDRWMRERERERGGGGGKEREKWGKREGRDGWERERERGGGGKWGREGGREKKSWAAGVNVGRLTKQLHQVITLLLSLHHLPPSFFNPGPSPSLVCLRRHRGRGVKTPTSMSQPLLLALKYQWTGREP